MVINIHWAFTFINKKIMEIENEQKGRRIGEIGNKESGFLIYLYWQISLVILYEINHTMFWL